MTEHPENSGVIQEDTAAQQLKAFGSSVDKVVQDHIAKTSTNSSCFNLPQLCFHLHNIIDKEIEEALEAKTLERLMIDPPEFDTKPDIGPGNWPSPATVKNKLEADGINQQPPNWYANVYQKLVKYDFVEHMATELMREENPSKFQKDCAILKIWNLVSTAEHNSESDSGDSLRDSYSRQDGGWRTKAEDWLREIFGERKVTIKGETWSEDRIKKRRAEIAKTEGKRKNKADENNTEKAGTDKKATTVIKKGANAANLSEDPMEQ